MLSSSGTGHAADHDLPQLRGLHSFENREGVGHPAPQASSSSQSGKGWATRPVAYLTQDVCVLVYWGAMAQSTLHDRDKSHPAPALDLLLHEMSESRDDERYMGAQFGVLITVALALITTLAALFYNTCAGEGCNKVDQRLWVIPSWIYIVSPMLLTLLVSYAVILSTQMTLRSYYLRNLERKIHLLTGQSGASYPLPSWSHLHLEVAGQGRAGLVSRLNWYLVHGLMAVLSLACLCIAIMKIPSTRLRIFGLAVNLALFSIPALAAFVNVAGGARIWKYARHNLPQRLERTDNDFPKAMTKERSLASFLLLPRYREELLKALFIPITFFVVLLATGSTRALTREVLWHMIIYFVVFELFGYQARYLFNDVKDRHVDCSTALQKRRFPCSLKDEPSAVVAAYTVVGLRLSLVLLFIGCILPYNHLAWLWHFAFVVAIFVIAVPYEMARQLCNQAALSHDERKLRLWTVLLVGVVGFGYGLRTVVGLWLSGRASVSPFVWGFVGASLFGSTFVVLTWGLESTRAAADQLSIGKAHLGVLRGFLERAHRRSGASISSSAKVLAERQHLFAPWSFLSIAATLTLLLFSMSLVRIHLESRSLIWIGLAVVLLSGLAVVMRVSGCVVYTAAIFLIIFIFLMRHSVLLLPSIVAAAVAALPLITTCIFRGLCFDDLLGASLHQSPARSRSVYEWLSKAR